VARAACDPTSRNYWQAVAKRVSGKSAQQCYDKVNLRCAGPCLGTVLTLAVAMTLLMRHAAACSVMVCLGVPADTGLWASTPNADANLDMFCCAGPGAAPHPQGVKAQRQAAGRSWSGAAAQGPQRCTIVPTRHAVSRLDMPRSQKAES
jgi:hypothetical protein